MSLGPLHGGKSQPLMRQPFDEGVVEKLSHNWAKSDEDEVPDYELISSVLYHKYLE